MTCSIDGGGGPNKSKSWDWAVIARVGGGGAVAAFVFSCAAKMRACTSMGECVQCVVNGMFVHVLNAFMKCVYEMCV